MGESTFSAADALRLIPTIGTADEAIPMMANNHERRLMRMLTSLDQVRLPQT
jgi:hypothetical protein